MVKKNKGRHTQESPTIQNGGDSAESGDQKKACSSGFSSLPEGSKCTHIQKAIDMGCIKRALKYGCLAGDCPGCIKDGVKKDGEEGGGLWLCLQCGHQGCGRTEQKHALKHFQVQHSDPHCMVVNTTSWNVWCYNCEVELPCEYRKKLQECVKYLRNLDCPSPVRITANSCTVSGNKEIDVLGCSSMPLTDVTNMPHGLQRAPKKKMVGLPRVRGLQNLGNTCFFNSVLQCLTQTPHLLELLQDLHVGNSRFQLPGGPGLLPQEEDETQELDPLEGTLTKWGSLTEALVSTLEELRQDDATAVNPQRLLNKFTTKCPQFGGGDQHDAHELLRHLLDEVRTEDLKRYYTAILDKFGLNRHDTSETVEGSVHSRVRAYGRQAGELLPLLPDPIFRGTLVSTVECQDCMHSTQRSEPFYELSLPVTTNKPQPPVMRRKAGGDDSFDLCGNVTSDTPSKHQLKKERQQQRKMRKVSKYHLLAKISSKKSASALVTSANEPAITEEEAAENIAESEQSDADVEDNVEQDVLHQEVNTGGLVVNGEALSLKLSNGYVSDNENIEEQRTLKEGSVKRTECNGDMIYPVTDNLCNGIDNKNFVVERDSIKENGVDVHFVNKQSAESKEEALYKKGTFQEGNEDIGLMMVDSKKPTDQKIKVGINKKIGKRSKNKINDVQDVNASEESVDNIAIGRDTFDIKITNLENLFGEGSCTEEINNIEDEECDNKIISENYMIEKINSGSESTKIKAVSDNLLFQHTEDNCKEVSKEELSLSISATGHSPSTQRSPSPGSSSLNAETSVPLMPASNWQNEDTDRPLSRIAFCPDNDSITSNNSEQQTELSTENVLNVVHKTPGRESGGKEVAGDQLVKDMAGLSLAHEERQSPSHWDTCSAHSLEDAVKESKLTVPLEGPLCNGGGHDHEPETLDSTDKSGTLAPRYQCGDKECSIESCLNQFTLLELMTGSCKVICDNCTERINRGKKGKMVATNSTKQYLVSNPPAVLVLHLKRFEVHQNMFRKTPRHVTFPMLLDIAPICNTKCCELPTMHRGQSKVLYSLYGVVQHSGTLHGGHYSAYVKVRAPVRRDDMRWCFLPTSQCPQRLEELSRGEGMPTEPVPGKWYHVSDSRVNEVNEERVLHSQAYLLFYERVW